MRHQQAGLVHHRQEPDGLEGHRLAAGVRSGVAFAKVTNLLDREYYTAAQLGTTGFTQTGAVASRPFAEPVIGGERPLLHTTFFAPGAPRMLWLGVRMDLGRKSASTR